MEIASGVQMRVLWRDEAGGALTMRFGFAPGTQVPGMSTWASGSASCSGFLEDPHSVIAAGSLAVRAAGRAARFFSEHFSMKSGPWIAESDPLGRAKGSGRVLKDPIDQGFVGSSGATPCRRRQRRRPSRKPRLRGGRRPRLALAPTWGGSRSQPPQARGAGPRS